MCMHFIVLTLFPEMFPGMLQFSLANKARQKGIWNLSVMPIREYAYDRHKTVDDAGFGGGCGLVMRADVIDRALSAGMGLGDPNPPLFLYPSPRGRRLTQPDLQRFVTTHTTVVLLCGRYKGVDQRLLDHWRFEEVSLGDFILSGGELAALAIMDGCIRLLPGVIGSEEVRDEETFTQGLLEHPLYTRPQEWKGHAVPEILLSGDHAKIAAWRREQAQDLTRARRPDLWAAHQRQNGQICPHDTDKR